MKTPTNHNLPTRKGVSPSVVALPDDPQRQWPTILDFLVDRFTLVDRQTWRGRMARSEVVDEHGQLVTPDRPYQALLRVYYYRELPAETPVPFQETVIYQDEHLVVADKPHFLPVLPSGHYLQESLLVRLKNKLGIDELSPLHRLDRETAGVVVFGVQRQERGAYQELFRLHKVAKEYEAIAPWRPQLQFPLVRKSRIVQGEPFFRRQEVEGEPNSETHMNVIEVLPAEQTARYRLNPISGKTHQLRVHMNALGLPIINDRIYPPRNPTPDDDYRYPLQLLGKRISFVDPFTQKLRAFESGLRLN